MPNTTIGRSTWTDDDGSGTTGTILNNARLQGDVYDRIDTLFAAGAGLAFAGPILERGRTTPMGEWTPIPFSAGNFTGSGSMTWTVVSGAVATLAYTMIGRTCFLFFNLSGTVGGTLSTDLFIALPFNPTISSPGIIRMGSGAGGTPWSIGIVYFLVGQSKAGFQLGLTTGNLPAGTQYVQGMGVCQI